MRGTWAKGEERFTHTHTHTNRDTHTQIETHTPKDHSFCSDIGIRLSGNIYQDAVDCFLKNKMVKSKLRHLIVETKFRTLELIQNAKSDVKGEGVA